MRVTVKVTDDGQGHLSAAVSGLPEAGATFKNTYSAEKTSATLTGTKTLEGRKIEAGEFRVALYASDADGNVAEGAEPVATGNVGTDGKFSVSTGDLTAAGDYHYVLKEVDTGKGGVSYDSTAYQVTVKVTDDG